MLLDVLHAVVGQVTHQHLPPQVQHLVHHVPEPVEQIPLALLRGGGREEAETLQACTLHPAHCTLHTLGRERDGLPG